ncbi:MAG TPA: ABC transporter substrate-binding protein [Stellaceae bacterium]|nr:ABC transporter substrate-binding protein [Stellaceae bacterium]
MNRMAAALVVWAVTAATSAAADPVHLRVGWVSGSSDVPLVWIGPKDLTRHQGVSYVLDITHFQGSPPQITALAANEIDFVGFGFSAMPTAVQNAHMTDLRIIADMFQDGAPGGYSNEFLVLKDGPIHSIADMRGRVAATNSAGSAVDMVLRAIFRKNGLEPNRDVAIIEAGFGAMPVMLKEQKVDLVPGTRLTNGDPALRAYARTLFTQKDAIGRAQMAELVARQGFLEKNRAAVVDYLEDSLRELVWFSDPAHHDAAVKIFSDFTKIPAAQFASWLYVKGEDYYKDPQGMPDLDALQANIDTMRALGFTKETLDIKNYADLSYVTEAAARLR